MAGIPKQFRLANIGNVLGELRRVYTMAHHGQMTWQDASCASRILREVRHCLEAGDFEQRLAELERAAGIAAPIKSNGRARPEARH